MYSMFAVKCKFSKHIGFSQPVFIQHREVAKASDSFVPVGPFFIFNLQFALMSTKFGGCGKKKTVIEFRKYLFLSEGQRQ